IDGGTISGSTGMLLFTDGGAIGVYMSHGEIGDIEAPLSGDGIVAELAHGLGGFIDITTTAIYANGTGISALVADGTAGYVDITANGTISADVGIDARVGDGAGSAADSDISITTEAAITAVSAGIVAEVNQNSAGDIDIEVDGALTVSA